MLEQFYFKNRRLPGIFEVVLDGKLFVVVVVGTLKISTAETMFDGGIMGCVCYVNAADFDK